MIDDNKRISYTESGRLQIFRTKEDRFTLGKANQQMEIDERIFVQYMQNKKI